MSAVWKFPLATALTDNALEMPKGAKVVHVGIQGERICLWAIVDMQAPVETRVFQIVGTGHEEVKEGMAHVGTVQQGPWVWHVFEVWPL